MCGEHLSHVQQHLNFLQEFLLLDEEKEQITDLRLQRSVSFLNELYSDWAISIEHMTARWRSVHYEKPKKFRKGRVRDSTSSARSLLHESASISVVHVNVDVETVLIWNSGCHFQFKMCFSDW